jgi:hypothetical protein
MKKVGELVILRSFRQRFTSASTSFSFMSLSTVAPSPITVSDHTQPKCTYIPGCHVYRDIPERLLHPLPNARIVQGRLWHYKLVFRSACRELDQDRVGKVDGGRCLNRTSPNAAGSFGVFPFYAVHMWAITDRAYFHASCVGAHLQLHAILSRQTRLKFLVSPFG